jgi:hypothetical protein
MMDGMFHKFGLLWAPRFEKNAHGKPEPVNQDDLQEVYARLSHSRVDKETQRDTATRLEYLYAINDPKTPALTKLRFYNTGKVTDLFTDNELNAFAPRGYKEVKSILFPIRTRLEHLGQLAQAVQEAIRLAPLMLLDQMAADLRNEEAKERKDEGHHGH